MISWVGLMVAERHFVNSAEWTAMTPEQRVADVELRRLSEVKSSLATAGLSLGNPVYFRIMKESSDLEVWLQPSSSARYQLYKTFPIARWSGTLGPKQKEGDRQAPEGRYGITRRLMHPGSTYHLAFNIGYPNQLDQALGRTGNLIMIHGKNVSVGCFAMTDSVIEELYLIVDAALKGGQDQVCVDCFPFRMTEERLSHLADNELQWNSFWSQLQPIWNYFEEHRVPPPVTVVDKRYVVSQ